MYHNKNEDYVYLIWKDLVFQVENKNSKKNIDMYYPRFTKVIVDYFMAKHKAIPRKNKMFWHFSRDDSIFTIIRVISKHQDTRLYGALLPQHLTNQAMLKSESYKSYHAYAIGEMIPKPKYVQKKADSDTSPKKKPVQAPKGKQLKATAKVSKSGKNKLPAQGLETLSEMAFGSGADEGTSVSPGVLDLSTFDEEERHDEKKDEEEEGLYLRVQTPSHFESTNEAYDDVTQAVNVREEKLDEDMTNEEEVDELYNDVNINLEEKDTEMTDASLTNVQATQVTKNTHVIMTVVTSEAQQQSSSISSGFISNMLNPNPDTVIDSNLNLNTESTSLQQTLVPPAAIVPSNSLQNLPTFGSLFKFKDRVKALEDDFLEFKQRNLFSETVSLIPGDAYLANKMNEAVKIVVQLQLDRLRDQAQAENEDFINKLDENIKKIIKEQVKVQVKEKVFKILPRIENLVNDQLESEVLTRSSNEAKTSHVVAANLSKLELKKILIDKMLKVDTLTPKLLVGPTFKLMKVSCKGLVELEYFLEEVYKETTDQLDWNNPKGQQYPHDLCNPLPLIPNSKGRRVIPFDHFINNDLAYLWGGASS
nr:hypothetical protein [Tanacetum cinerariifolium]